MITKTFTLPPKCFFHARPAGVFASAAAKFDSMVMVGFGSEFADGKRAISLMRLPPFRGKEFEVTIDGADEQRAMAELEELLTTIFQE